MYDFQFGLAYGREACAVRIWLYSGLAERPNANLSIAVEQGPAFNA